MTLRNAAASLIAVAAIAPLTAIAAPTPAPMAAPAPAISTGATPMPLTLAQAEAIALAQSPTLAAARAAVTGANAAIGEARSGGLPNLSASGSDVRSRSGGSGFGSNGGASPAPNSGGPTLATSTSGSVNLRQLIIDGGRIHNSVEAAKYSSDASRLDLERQIQNVDFGVASAYYAALQARHTLAVARDSLNLAQVQERLVEAQFKAGVASRADVLTAQLPVAQAALLVAQDSNGEQTQIASLLDTMGLPADTPVAIADEQPGAVMLPPLDEVMNTAMKQRPDLLSAQASLDAANASVRSARLGLFPTISGTGSDGVAATKIDTVPNSGNYSNSYSLGLVLSFPLFDGGLTRSQTVAAQAQADQAAANLKSTQLLVSLNIEQAYLGVQTAQSGLTAADAEYAQARTVLDVTNAQYKSGVTTLPLLLNAQVGLAKAEGDQVNAVYTYKTAWQQLLLSEGTIGLQT
jgi:outer membrane protein